MTEMRDLIATMPEQLRWAAAYEPPAVTAASSAVVGGMGGSGIAGDVAAVVAESEGARVTVHKGYGLPGWMGDELLVAVSHSGNTEETLSAVDAAASTGRPWAAVSTGGALRDRAAAAGAPRVDVPFSPQPRAAFGYLAGGVLRILESAGVIGPQSSALAEAADVVEGLLAGPAHEAAAAIADRLSGRVTVVYGGSGLAGVAANRWKTQVNENGKAPAYWSTLPELDHNELVGWTAHPGLGRDAIGVVFLHDSGDHPRVKLRARLTRELMTPAVALAGEVSSAGEGVLARLFSLTVVGDLVSVGLAERAGVDPVPVAVIEDLKRRLAASEGGTNP
jgi:glucose/mannose-6-phosphate isomerase